MPRKSKKPKDCGCGRGPVHCMSKAAVVKEHVDLLETLTNPTSKKLKKEAGEQSAELAQILKPVREKKGKGKSPMEIALLIKRKDRKMAGMEHLPITTKEVEGYAQDIGKIIRNKTKMERAKLREPPAPASALPKLDFTGLGRRRRLRGGYNTGLKSQADTIVGVVKMEEFGDPKYKPIASKLEEELKTLASIQEKVPHVEPMVIQQLQNDLKKAKDALAAYRPPDAKLMTDELRRERVRAALETMNPDGSCVDKYMKDNKYDEYMLGPSEMDLATATEKIEEAREESAVIVAFDLKQKATEFAEALTDEQEKEDMLGAIGRFYQLPSILELEKYRDILSGKYTTAMAAADAVQDLQVDESLLAQCKDVENEWWFAKQQYESGFLASAKAPFAEVNPLVLPTICQRAYSKTTARSRGTNVQEWENCNRRIYGSLDRSRPQADYETYCGPKPHVFYPSLGYGRPHEKKELIQNLLDELKENDCGCGCNGENKPSKLRGGALDDCPAGYDNHGLTCLERCGENEVDTGLFCMGPKNCPAGQRDDGTSCWDDLKCETHWNPNCVKWGPVFGHEWWTGCAVTTCNGGPRVQTKQTRAKTIVGRVNWAKTGEEIRSGFQAAFGPDSALARAFDPEKNGVAEAFRKFGRMASEAFKQIGKFLQSTFVEFLSGRLFFGQIFDFMGALGESLEGKISGPELGSKFLGALSQVVSLAASAVSGGATGVLLRVLSSGLKVLGGVAEGKQPSLHEIAELAADIIPSGASKLGKWGTRMREAIEIGINFLPHEAEEAAGETFANASEASVEEPHFTQEQVDQAEAKLVDARDTLEKLQFVDTAKIEIGRRATEEAQVWCQFKDMAKTMYPDDEKDQNAFANRFLDSAMGNRPRAAAMKDAYLKAEKKKEPTPEEKLTAALDYFRNKETTDEADAAEIDAIVQSFDTIGEQKYSDEYYALHKKEIDDQIAEEHAAIVKDATDILEGEIEKVQEELDEKLATNAEYEAALAPTEMKIKKLIEEYNAERGKDTAMFDKQPEFQKKYGISFDAFDNQSAFIQQSMYEQFMNPLSMNPDDNGKSMDIIADFIAAGGKPKFKPSSGVPPLRPTLPSVPAPAPVSAGPTEPTFEELGQQSLAEMEAYGNSLPAPLGSGRKKKLKTLGRRGGAGTKKQLEELGDSIEQAAREGIITKRDKRRLDDIVYTGFAEIRSLPKRTAFQYVTGQPSPAQDAKDAVVDRVTADFEAAGTQIRLRGNDTEYGQTFRDFVIYRTFAPELERAMMTRNDINNALQEHYGFQPRHEMGDWPTDTVSVVNPMSAPSAGEGKPRRKKSKRV